MGDGRGLGIGGNCIFVGHGNCPGFNMLSTSSSSTRSREAAAGASGARSPPCLKAIRASTIANCARGHKTSRGEDRYILVRNAGPTPFGRMETYRIDMNTCLPTSKSEITDFGGQSHEFLWHDPMNSNRVLVLHDQFGLPACRTPIVPA